MHSSGAADSHRVSNQQEKECAMKQIPFITAVMVFATFATTSNLFAQIATVTDNTCVAVVQCANGNGDDGCNSTTFNVTSTGTYYLKMSVDDCASTVACKKCLAEAWIYENTTPPTQVHCGHSVCGESTCSPTVDNVQLAPTVFGYTLYCCKLNCPGVGTCADCGTACVARAELTK